MKLFEAFGTPTHGSLKNVELKRIDKNRVTPTINHISQLTGIPKKDLHKLGTTGKTETSGDIDLGVEAGKYDFEQIHQRMQTKLGDENCSYNPHTRIASYAVPIMRKSKDKFVPVENGGNVEVDIAFVPNIDWAKFSYHAESGKGKKPTAYKGAVRTALLKAVAATFNEEGVDKAVYDPEESDLVIRIGRKFDMNRGLRRNFQVRPERKRRKEGDSLYLSRMRTVDTVDLVKPELDRLKKKYPGVFDDVEIDVDDNELVIDDPDDFLKLLFPGKPVVKQNDVKTTEDIIRLIKTRFDVDRRREIVNNVRNNTTRLQTRMRVPEWDEEFRESTK